MKVTAEGLKALQQELEYLQTVKRVEVGEALKKARAFGDLSENSEYDDAKNEQGKVEGRINELIDLLANIEIIDSVPVLSETVSFGNTVKIISTKNKREYIYTIRGVTEADPLKNRISNESPVGKALLGHKAGDVVHVETPAGITEYKILEIMDKEPVQE